MPEGLFNTNKQSSSKEYGFQEATLFKFLEIGAVFFQKHELVVRTTSPFCNLYSGLIRPLFHALRLYAECDKSNFWHTF